jgi:hypothetical protein
MPNYHDFLEFDDALAWDDMLAPASALSPGATPANPIIFGPSGSIRVFGFGIGEDLGGTIQIPHSWSEGTIIHPHVHWSPVNTSTGNVAWSLDYYWLNVNAAAVAAPTTITTPDQAGSGVAWAHQLVSFPTIVGTGKLISSILIFRLSRVAATAPPALTGDAALLSFDVHIQKNTVGSRQLFTK